MEAVRRFQMVDGIATYEKCFGSELGNYLEVGDFSCCCVLGALDLNGKSLIFRLQTSHAIDVVGESVVQHLKHVNYGWVGITIIN